MVITPMFSNVPSKYSSSNGRSDFKLPFSSKNIENVSGVTTLLTPFTFKVAVSSA